MSGSLVAPLGGEAALPKCFGASMYSLSLRGVLRSVSILIISLEEDGDVCDTWGWCTVTVGVITETSAVEIVGTSVDKGSGCVVTGIGGGGRRLNGLLAELAECGTGGGGLLCNRTAGDPLIGRGKLSDSVLIGCRGGRGIGADLAVEKEAVLAGKGAGARGGKGAGGRGTESADGGGGALWTGARARYTGSANGGGGALWTGARNRDTGSVDGGCGALWTGATIWWCASSGSGGGGLA